MTTMEKRFHHISEKGNSVYVYNVKHDTKVIATVFSKNVATAFCKAIDTINSNVMNMEEKETILVSILHVVHHSNNKLEGLDSVSTSCLHNPICLARMATDSICKSCYASAQQQMQHGLDDHNALNAYILQNFLFTEKALARLGMYTMFCRIESFGDVASVIQAVNYIRIIRAHANQHFAIWSKNLAIWADAFKADGKPENTTFVQSSVMENKRDTKYADFVDHVFTVWSNEQIAAENGVSISCGGRKCLTCLHCYHKNTSFYVDELKK